MVRVHFDDPEHLASFEAFLISRFPGEVDGQDDAVELTFRLELHAQVEQKIVERLIQAWRVCDPIETDDGFVASDQSEASSS